MKKVFAMIAIAMASLVLASCNGNKENNAEEATEEGQEMVEEGQTDLEAQAEIEAQLLGEWKATMPTADGKDANYTLTFKEGSKYDLVEAQEGTAADKLLNVTDADYTIEANKVVLSHDGSQLEFTDGKLYCLNAEGAHATADDVAYIYTKVVAE